jgi:hypothetical protein
MVPPPVLLAAAVKVTLVPGQMLLALGVMVTVVLSTFMLMLLEFTVTVLEQIPPVTTISHTKTSPLA